MIVARLHRKGDYPLGPQIELQILRTDSLKAFI